MLPFDVKPASISSLKKCRNKCLTSGSRHIVYLPLFDSDFWATVIFKRCHFVLYTVLFVLFGHSHFEKAPFYMLHCLDGIFLASHFLKVPFCILQFGPVFLATVIFKRCFLESCTVWFGFFGPQSFLKCAILYLKQFGSVFLATVIFERCHFVSCTAWIEVFWPQSFLKGAIL